MMVFLTSIASITLDKITPLLPKSPKDLSVAFIPTAADLYDEKSWMVKDRDKLVELGFSVEDVDLKGFKGMGLKKKLSEKDIIFVAGGTTTYLLQKARESGFVEIVKELVKNGKIYIGSSAGSVLAGPDVEIDRLFDLRKLGMELESYEGFGLIDFVPVPHADNLKYSGIIKEIENKFSKRFKLIPINDTQALMVKNGEVSSLD